MENNMLQYPRNYMISSGTASASHQLVSFDSALIDAGISNYNLLRVSSILPIGCSKKEHIDIKEGSALLVAYGSISSNIPGETIASAIGIGIPQHESDVGVIMEYADRCSSQTAEHIVHDMVLAAMKNHGILCSKVQLSSVEATVSEGQYVSVISSVAMW